MSARKGIINFAKRHTTEIHLVGETILRAASNGNSANAALRHWYGAGGSAEE